MITMVFIAIILSHYALADLENKGGHMAKQKLRCQIDAVKFAHSTKLPRIKNAIVNVSLNL